MTDDDHRRPDDEPPTPTTPAAAAPAIDAPRRAGRAGPVLAPAVRRALPRAARAARSSWSSASSSTCSTSRACSCRRTATSRSSSARSSRVVILVGATVLSNAPQLRSSSIALADDGSSSSLIIRVGLARARALAGEGRRRRRRCRRRSVDRASHRSSPRSAVSSKFTPVEPHGEDRRLLRSRSPTARTGPHTLDFDDPTTLFAGLQRQRRGREGRPRHLLRHAGRRTRSSARSPATEAAGMKGTVTVTGPTDDARPRRSARGRQPADGRGSRSADVATARGRVSASRTASIVAGQRADAFAVGVDLHRHRRVERLELDARRRGTS